MFIQSSTTASVLIVSTLLELTFYCWQTTSYLEQRNIIYWALTFFGSCYLAEIDVNISLK
jgi:hypothetical protein